MAQRENEKDDGDDIDSKFAYGQKDDSRAKPGSGHYKNPYAVKKHQAARTGGDFFDKISSSCNEEKQMADASAPRTSSSSKVNSSGKAVRFKTDQYEGPGSNFRSQQHQGHRNAGH